MDLRAERSPSQLKTRDLVVWTEFIDEPLEEDFRYVLPEKCFTGRAPPPTVTFFSSSKWGIESIEIGSAGDQDSKCLAVKQIGDKKANLNLFL